MKLCYLSEGIDHIENVDKIEIDNFFAAIRNSIPERYVGAFDTAMGYRKRVTPRDGYRAQAKAVAAGKRPLLYGYRKDVIEDLCDEFDLEYMRCTEIQSVGYLPENKHLAELTAYIHQHQATLRHPDYASSQLWDGLVGLLLGYKLDDIYEWSALRISHNDPRSRRNRKKAMKSGR